MTSLSAHALARLGAVVAGLALILAGVVPSVLSTGTPLYPDLAVLPPRDLQLDRTDVSPDGSGVIHNVLRFSNAVVNEGEGPLLLLGDIDPTSRQGPAVQRVVDSAGGFIDHPVGNLYYHAIHNHYHFDGWGLYQLWTRADYDKWIASGRTQGQAKKVGTKTTSCVLDEEFIATRPTTPWPAQYSSAGCQPDATWQLKMGLSPGWGDTYDYYRYEQWIDLGTETLADGEWVLRSISDQGNALHESPGKGDAARESLADNEAITAFRVTGGRLVDSNAPDGTLSVNHVDATTASADVRVQVLGRDDVSGVASVRLSNDGTSWATVAYSAPGPSAAQDLPWNLADARYGGTSAPGPKTVYAQVQDRTGLWSPTLTDTIDLAAPTGYAGVVAADAPAGYWRLGEASGVNAVDQTGRNPGTFEGSPGLGATSLLAAEPGNRAVAFDGANDHVGVPSSASLGVSGAFSLEAWIRPSALPAAGGFASILTKPESYSLQFNGPRLEFTVIQNGARRRLQAPAGAVVAGRTYHVVGTIDGTTQRLYVDGTQVASATIAGGASVTSNALRIGSWNGTKEFFTGTLDELAVYPTALPASRVAAHRAAGAGSGTPVPSSSPTPTPAPTAAPTPTLAPSAWESAVQADAPVSWWRLNEIEGTTLHDARAANPGAIWNSPLMGQPGLVANDPSRAFRFNGTSQYLGVPSSASLSVGSAFSLEAWIRPTSLPAAGAFASVITKAESYSLQFNGPRLELTVIQNGVRRRVQAPAGAVVAGTAYHVVGTYDGATQRLYLNGTLVATASLTGAATSTTTALRIASWNGAKEFFAGTIDEVAVYATALSAARVAAHWTAATGTAPLAGPTAPPATQTPGASQTPTKATPAASPTPAPTLPASPTPRSTVAPQPTGTPAPSAAATTTPVPSAAATATAGPSSPVGSPPPSSTP